MKRKMELLAPGGDIESVKAAIVAGADAIYLGLPTFNARMRATNVEFNNLTSIVQLAHRNNCEIFITINIIIVESEIRALINLLNNLVNRQIDGVIVQDLGLLYLLSTYFKNLKIHASTQLTTHNQGQIRFLSKLSVTRVNLSRELTLAEIKPLTQFCHENNLLSEVFVHGSNCLSYSGICYLSSVLAGKSANRGRCNQTCREQYLTTPEGKAFPLNLKDNSAFNNLRGLYEAGVDSVKIEGRMKTFPYVYTVVNSWRKLLNNFYNHNQASGDDADLYQVFNRDFTNAFLMGDLNKNVFTDSPRDHSAHYFHATRGRPTDQGIKITKTELQAIRAGIVAKVKTKIAGLDVESDLLNISVSGGSGTPLKVSVATADTSDIEPIETPRLKREKKFKIQPRLSVLISCREQLEPCRETTADIFFQLPSCFSDDYGDFVNLFLENLELTPWFPSVLIGKNFTVATDLLDLVKPKRIVTNNTGIAFEASKRGIPWIAGPYLNIVNSFSLLCLKEKFQCSGSFISNEISKNQIERIITPKDFKLYYSIYCPVLLLTSRQCLHHPIEGCDKGTVDEECTLDCKKTSSITNLKDVVLYVDKSKGCYHRVYNNYNFLNTDIVTDLPDRFSGFFIDLTEVKTETKRALNEKRIIKLFETLLNGKPGSKKELEEAIHPAMNIQYKKGI